MMLMPTQTTKHTPSFIKQLLTLTARYQVLLLDVPRMGPTITTHAPFFTWLPPMTFQGVWHSHSWADVECSQPLHWHMTLCNDSQKQRAAGMGPVRMQMRALATSAEIIAWAVRCRKALKPNRHLIRARAVISSQRNHSSQLASAMHLAELMPAAFPRQVRNCLLPGTSTGSFLRNGAHEAELQPVVTCNQSCQAN